MPGQQGCTPQHLTSVTLTHHNGKIIFQLSLSPGKEPRATENTRSSPATAQWSSEQTYCAGIIGLTAWRSASLSDQRLFFTTFGVIINRLLHVPSYSHSINNGDSGRKENIRWSLRTAPQKEKMSLRGRNKTPSPAIQRLRSSETDFCKTMHIQPLLFSTLHLNFSSQYLSSGTMSCIVRGELRRKLYDIFNFTLLSPVSYHLKDNDGRGHPSGPTAQWA